jgi:hypothetical protein
MTCKFSHGPLNFFGKPWALAPLLIFLRGEMLKEKIPELV